MAKAQPRIRHRDESRGDPRRPDGLRPGRSGPVLGKICFDSRGTEPSRLRVPRRSDSACGPAHRVVAGNSGGDDSSGSVQQEPGCVEHSRGGDPVTDPAQIAPQANREAIAGAYLTRAKTVAVLLLLALVLIVAVIVAATFGSVHISLVRAFADPSSPDHVIFFAARLPRLVMGIIVGAVLAAVGAALQALVRNPLAEGGILGISGGGALGAIIALVFLSRLGGAETAVVPFVAFGAALASTVAVYRLAEVDGQLEPFTLLLVGVIFNAFWGAAIMLVNSVVNFYYAHTILFWLMGSLEAPTWHEVALVAALGFAGFIVLMYYA